MSCFIIELKNGAKVMRQVTNREEYIRLRDLKYHVDDVLKVREGNEEVKRHLLQFNYSCIPAEDGKLRGCRQPSTSVGMDIDHIDKDRMSEVADMILEKKEELGLLMLEKSARGEGYHIVFRRHPELSQEENLRWASNLLGVEFDKGAKDITRVFYATTASEEDLLFLDDELFTCEPAPQLPQKGEVVDTSDTPKEVVAVDKEKPSPSSLKAFDLCVAEAKLNPEELDVWGIHNWHSNLLSVLSVGLPKFMSLEQCLATCREKLPNYGATKDCERLVTDFYNKYNTSNSFMNVKQREINAKSQMLTETEDAEDVSLLTNGWEPPQMPKRLPRVIELAVGNFQPQFREMLAATCMPSLSAHASHFRAKYLNGKVIGPNQYVAIIGGSGKGKGQCTDLFKMLNKTTLQANDVAEWNKVRENEKLREQMKNSKQVPAKYIPKIRQIQTCSKSSIIKLQSNLGNNAMLLAQFSEVDQLFKSTTQAYSDISVILRKAWDGDTESQYYLSESSANVNCTMNMSMLMAGTVKAMLCRMFKDVENGMMQRCVPIVVPETKRTFRPPVQNLLNDAQCKELDDLMQSIYTKDLALGDDIVVLDLPRTTKAIGEWYDELEEQYNCGQLTDAQADLSHRCGEFMMRAAIPLVALEGKETKEIVDFVVWFGKLAFYNLCKIFGSRVASDLAEAKCMMPEVKTDNLKAIGSLLDALPEVFTLREMIKKNEERGGGISCRSAASRYVKDGKLTRLGRGLYKKVKMA